MDLHQALNIEGSDTEKGWSTYKGQDVSTGRPQSGIRHCFKQELSNFLSLFISWLSNLCCFVWFGLWPLHLTYPTPIYYLEDDLKIRKLHWKHPFYRPFYGCYLLLRFSLGIASKVMLWNSHQEAPRISSSFRKGNGTATLNQKYDYWCF